MSRPGRDPFDVILQFLNKNRKIEVDKSKNCARSLRVRQCTDVYTDLMIDKERGLQLLGSGLGPTDVATALGCDPSFVSQWLMDESFRAQVLALRMQSLQAQTQRDRQIDTIEDDLIRKLQDSVQYLLKPKDILMAFQILNNAKRRGATTTGNINLTQNVVTINMPPVAKQHYFPKTNAQGEVVQVGDQVTVTKSLQQLLQERTKEKLTAQDAEVLNEDVSRKGSGSAAIATASRSQ